ncbi:hypothetical protein PV350_29195 [Streptomyces sp. PA03-6a]|nr:hypothetical protein [Streptomyces sp. PA03-6a]
MSSTGDRHGGTADVRGDGGCADQDRWFVGFRFRTPRGSVGRQFFVVGEADDAEDAVAIALARASLPRSRAAREDDAEIDGVEVRRLRWDPLGWVYLSNPCA